jgi:hypothetical protein
LDSPQKVCAAHPFHHESALQIVHPLAGRDEVTAREPDCNPVGQLTGDHSCVHLIEVTHPFLHGSRRNQRAASPVMGRAGLDKDMRFP